jgi:hypothetical protein
MTHLPFGEWGNLQSGSKLPRQESRQFDGVVALHEHMSTGQIAVHNPLGFQI